MQEGETDIQTDRNRKREGKRENRETDRQTGRQAEKKERGGATEKDRNRDSDREREREINRKKRNADCENESALDLDQFLRLNSVESSSDSLPPIDRLYCTISPLIWPLGIATEFLSKMSSDTQTLCFIQSIGVKCMQQFICLFGEQTLNNLA